MSLAEIAIKRPSLIIVVFAVLTLGGLLSYKHLSYELMPDFKVPTLVVMTPYPGASPSDVEQSVTKKIEDALSSLDRNRSMISMSQEGVSVVVVEFLYGTDMDFKQQEAQRVVNNILSTLPEEVKAPSVRQISPSDAPVMQLTAVSKMGSKEFYDLVEDELLPLFQQVEGIGEIHLIGGQQREIKVHVNRERLEYYRLSLSQVTQAIRTANMDFPTGKVKSPAEQITVRLAGKFQSVQQLRDLVVGSQPKGGPIRLSDIAEVEDGVKEIKSINRFNGQEGIGIIVKKQGNANAVEISKQIKARIKTIEERYADRGVKIITADDTSVFTIEAADAVTHDLIIAVILVAAVMLLFLHSLRDSLIVMVAIPSSLVATFIAMYVLGYSLNLMTLLAMSLVVGILVDDSIVVLENIHRHLHMGKPRVKATLDGRAEIGFSAIAITLVDVVVFAPIAMVDTVIGDILRQFSVTIVVSTLMSLFVCFTITPLLASRFGKVSVLDPAKWNHKPLLWFEHMLHALTEAYGRQLSWALRHKVLTALGVLACFALTGYVSSLGIMGQEMVAQGDRGKFLLKLEYDRRTPLQENNLQSLSMEQFLLSQPEVKSVFSNIGGATTQGMGAVSGVGLEHKSEMVVELVAPTQRKEKTEKFMIRMRRTLMDLYPGVNVKTGVIGLGGGEEPIYIVLQGEDQQLLMQGAQQLKHLIASMPGASDVTVTVEEGNPELHVDIDREKMAQLGLNMGVVGATMQNAFAGNTDAKYRAGNNEYDINVRLDAFDRHNPMDVGNISFANNKGEMVRLSQFSNIGQSSGPGMLERKNRRASVSVKGNVLGITSGVLAKQIDAAIAQNPLPQGVEMKWSGDIERQADSFGALGTALLAAMVLMYLVMVALYDSFVHPFVVFFSVPVALIGALLALNLTMSSMSIFTMLGMIMLLGLVAKNGILLVDFAKHKQEEGLTTFNALIASGKARLRPILMTTISMVIGMIPIAIAKGAGAEWKNGLAIVMMGGLTSSLLLTVFVVPVAYYAVDRLQEKLGMKKKQEIPNYELEDATA